MRPTTDGDGGERVSYATTTTTGDTTITDPVSFQFFEVPAPYPLTNEAFIVVVSHPMVEMLGWPLSPLVEADGSVAGPVIAYIMDASTVEIPPTPPLPQFIPIPIFIPVPLTPLPLHPIPAPHTLSPHPCSPGVIPTTRSHSTGEKSVSHGGKWFEDHYGVKQNINGPHPFRQWFLRTNIVSQLTPGCEEGGILSLLD